MTKITPKKVHKTLSKYILADGFDLVLDLKKSKGTWLYDSLREAFFLDFFTFFASSPIGYNHPKLMEPEFIQKMGELAVNKPANSDLYTIEMAEFVETFARVAKPSYMKYMFFISGGALAVENGLKAAMDWKVRKNFDKGLEEEKGHKVIHFQNAFHGRSGYTLSLTNTFDPRKTKFFAQFDWPRITNPKLTFPLKKQNLAEVLELEKKALTEIREVLEEDADDICALIIEPVQGEGGDNHYRAAFFKELRQICNRFDIIFIVDEIQAGMGLTGKLWAHEHYDIKPDIIVFGKKTQVCGIMAAKRFDEVKDHAFKESSRLNSTWGGNLLDMVRSQKYLEIIEEENLIENAAAMGTLLLDGLDGLSKKHNGTLSNIRGKGLMCAFDLPDTGSRNNLVKKIYENMMIVLPAGERSIRFRPPLNVSREDIEKGLDIIDKSIKEI
ncbi:MAG: L-lysine 6-transaminase [bacterium]|nr:L-lysine 6-transaminase [bacterium]